MLYTTFLLFFSVLAQIEGNSNRRVNLALETVIKFDEKNLRSDAGLLDSMQGLLSRVRGALSQPSGRRINEVQGEEAGGTDRHIVDYMEAAIDTILTYDDKDLQSLARILNQEIRRYHYKGCKFHELANDEMFRKAMRESLSKLQRAPASAIRLQLTNALDALRNANEMDRNLIDFLNSLYTGEAKKKLGKTVENLKFYKIRRRADGRRDTVTLHHVVQNALKDVLFDQYSQLNENARKTIKVHINAFLDNLFNPHQAKRENTQLSKSDEIKDLTTKEGDKNIILRGAKNDEDITQGLSDASNVLSDEIMKVGKRKEPNKDTDSDTENDSPYSSSNESIEVTTTMTPKKHKKKANKPKTTPKAQTSIKAENSNTMRTMWEEIQTFAPQEIAIRGKVEPEERVIVEEHSAVINIGSWQNVLRSPKTESELNLRAADDKNDVSNGIKIELENDKTQESDEEGMSIEFDQKTKAVTNDKLNLRRLNDYENAQETLGNTNKELENTSLNSSPEIFSKPNSNENSSTSATTTHILMNMSTMDLSEEENDKEAATISTTNSSEALSVKNNKNSNENDEIKRRSNQIDDFNNTNPVLDEKESREEIISTKVGETKEHSTNNSEVSQNEIWENTSIQTNEKNKNDLNSLKEFDNKTIENVDAALTADGEDISGKLKPVQSIAKENTTALLYKTTHTQLDEAGEAAQLLDGSISKHISVN